MSTNVANATAGGAIASLQNLKAGLANVKATTKTKGGEPIMRLGRDGKWIFGAENLEVEAGSKWAINPLSLQHGFICWKVIPQGSKEKPELLGEEMVSMFEAKPLKGSLPDYGHEWADCLSFNILCLDGEDEGEQMLFKTSSTGGLKASLEFVGQLMAHLDADADHPVAVVELKSDSYQHKTYGKTYFPVFDIVDWVGMDGVAEAPAAAEAPKEEPKQEPVKQPEPVQQARRRGAAPAPAPEPEVEDDAPFEDDTPAEAAPVAAQGGEVRRRRRG